MCVFRKQDYKDLSRLFLFLDFFGVSVCNVTTGVNSSAAATGTFTVVFLGKLDR